MAKSITEPIPVVNNSLPTITSEQFPPFTTALDNFFILAERVLEYNAGGELILGSSKTNGIRTGFNGYREIYNQTRESKKHIEKFTEVYKKCRPEFIKEPNSTEDFMVWFRDNSSFIVSPMIKSPRKLYLTVIFRKCCKIVENIDDEAKRATPEKADQLLSDPASIYPEHFMLCLFRIFYHCADEIDRRTMILPRIKELETMIGISKHEVPAATDGLSDFFTSMTQMAREAGVEVPAGQIPQVSGNEFRDAMAGMTKDPQVKGIVKELFAEVKGAKDLPSAIGQIFAKMQTNAAQLPVPVQKSMDATADH